MKKNNSDLTYVKDIYMNKEIEALNKMYPNENTKDKYILFVQSELYFPFLKENIQADIEFIYENSIKKYKNKLRTPYPNKTITTISMVNGRKVCDLGIPLIFDNYEDLAKLKSISIKWNLDVITDKDTEEKYYIQVLYDVNFKCEENKKIYSIFSKDTVPHGYNDKKILDEYLDEFSKILLIKSYSKNNFSIQYIKGEEHKKDITQNEAFIAIAENMKAKGFIDAAKNNKNFTIFSYYASETIEPDIIARDIFH